jgi:hypothetical protein
MPGRYFLERRMTAYTRIRHILIRPYSPTHLVDVAENGLLDTLVLDDLTEDTSITSADDQDLLGIGVGVHGEVSDHLLV